MSKNKLKKFSELDTFQRVFQPGFDEVFNTDYKLKGKWNDKVFENGNPIVLELGCGRGEYTVGLAKMDAGKNYIGVDIKGARLWQGAKIANEEGLKNVAFLRTRIELIRSFFSQNEIDEIWITFPDPQLKKRRNKKRLTGARFLNSYSTFLKDMGIVNLKTDNDVMYQYTAELIKFNGLKPDVSSRDVHHSGPDDPRLQINTYYEKQFLEEGASINYIAFRLPAGQIINELPENV